MKLQQQKEEHNPLTEVVIVIKAPNQLIEDQLVQCQRNWSVKELKDHLQVVYPSKPLPTEQKLIYSGQLLSDKTILSDILRSYEGHENNTVHLVCTTRAPRWSYPQNLEKLPPTATLTPRSFSGPSPTPSPSMFSGQVGSRNVHPTMNNQSAGTPDTVRLRLNSEPVDILANANENNPEGAANVNLNSMGYNNTTYPYYISRPQLDLVQEAYIQYLNMCHQLALSANHRNLQETVPAVNQYFRMPTRESLHGVPRQPTPLPENPDAAPAPVAAVPVDAADEAEEEGQINRDLLEWVYIIFRLGVLFSFVYFYSSPMRFVLVVTMMLLLFYIDIERYRQRNIPEPPADMGQNVNDANPDALNENTPPVPRRNNIFSTIWTFISLFFLSLVPDLIN